MAQPGYGGTDKQRSGFAIIKGYLDQNGLGSLAQTAWNYVLANESEDSIYLQIRNTDAYKKRFAGNIARAKAGKPVLSEAEYLSTEKSYAQTLRNYGLPTGFYDHPDDFAKFIANDLSPTELQSRVSAIADFTNRKFDPDQKKAFADFGIGIGDLTAQMLDPTRATPLIQQKVNAIKISTAAYQQGLNASVANSNMLAAYGIDEDKARQGYSQIASILPGTENLADIYGTNYTQADAESEVFKGTAGTKRKQLASQERATFSGSSNSGLGGSNASGY